MVRAMLSNSRVYSLVNLHFKINVEDYKNLLYEHAINPLVQKYASARARLCRKVPRATQQSVIQFYEDNKLACAGVTYNPIESRVVLSSYPGSYQFSPSVFFLVKTRFLKKWVFIKT